MVRVSQAERWQHEYSIDQILEAHGNSRVPGFREEQYVADFNANECAIFSTSETAVFG